MAIKKFEFWSTNGTGNVLTFALLAIAAVYGIGENTVNALIAAAGPLILAVREIIKGIRKPRWTGNIITYVFSGILLLAPWLDDLLTVLQPIGNAIAEGNINALWGLLIPVINEILVLFRTKPWQPPGDPNPANA